MVPLTLETSTDGETTVIALTGELDLGGAASLEQALALRGDEPVVVDLRGLEFMDSSGLRALVVSAQRAQDAGRPFALIPGAPHVMRVFDITCMRDRLDFVAGPGEVTGSP